MKKRKQMVKRLLSRALPAMIALSLAGCGGRTAKTAGASVKEQAEAGALGNKIVNIGVTSSLNTLNPLLMDGVEINKYATGLMFLPLIELDKDMNFEPMLADSIQAEDEFPGAHRRQGQLVGRHSCYSG